MLKFTEEASQLLSNYIRNVRRSTEQAACDRDIDKRILEIFLSDMEDEIKFLAIQLSKARKAGVTERRDVQKALRNLKVELLRKRKMFSLYRKQLFGDVRILGERLESITVPRVLDAGCGWGRASRGLSKLLDKKAEIIGIDVDVLPLRYGKSLNNGSFFVRSHMNYLPFKTKTFNVVLSNKALHEIKDESSRRKTLSEFARVLNREGVIWISDRFVKSHAAKLIWRFIRRFFPRKDLYSEMNELEDLLKKSNFRKIRKNCISWPAIGLNAYCSFIVMKA